MPAFDKLTDREREVAVLLASGMQILKVGSRLGIGCATVYTHQVAIRKKLGVRTGAVLTLLAVREGLVSMHDDDFADEVP